MQTSSSRRLGRPGARLAVRLERRVPKHSKLWKSKPDGKDFKAAQCYLSLIHPHHVPKAGARTALDWILNGSVTRK
jgi:hypothetical protein